MAKLKGLGRGLDALLAGSADAGSEVLQSIAVDRIRAGKYQPRTRMDDASLEELASSIRAQGVIQPVLVRPVDGNRYELIAGERRWRAAQRAGLAEIPAQIRRVEDRAALALALIENIQRENLNALEEAQGIARLIDDFGLTHDAAAAAVGRSRSAVSNLLRLTQLAPPVQAMLLGGDLDMGHARALLTLPVGEQGGAASRIVARQMSVREAERMVQALTTQSANRAKVRRGRARIDADLARLEQELAERLGATVHVQPARKGAGRLIIGYTSLAQLDGILARLRR